MNWVSVATAKYINCTMYICSFIKRTLTQITCQSFAVDLWSAISSIHTKKKQQNHNNNGSWYTFWVMYTVLVHHACFARWYANSCILFHRKMKGAHYLLPFKRLISFYFLVCFVRFGTFYSVTSYIYNI